MADTRSNSGSSIEALMDEVNGEDGDDDPDSPTHRHEKVADLQHSRQVDQGVRIDGGGSVSGGSWKARLVQQIRENWKPFAVKPVLILYGLQFAVTGSVTTQLWLDRTCSVVLHFNDTICEHLTDKEWEGYESQVQDKVTDFNIVTTYLNSAPPILISLYLGPFSDKGRKRLMYCPFVGHLLAGIVPLMVVYFQTCLPQYLWFTSLYVLFGGLSVLNIAMYGYIGDVTTTKNRTAVMSILSGLGFVIFPLAEFVGGQIFKAGGFDAVYWSALATNIIAMLYIYFIPESVTRRRLEDDVDGPVSSARSTCRKMIHFIAEGNKSIVESFRCVVKRRPNNMRKFILMLLLISGVYGMMFGSFSIGLLYTSKKFQWTVVDYTNYSSVFFLCIAIRTFFTTPFYCLVLKAHDCVVGILGGLASIACYVTMALATEGWMMYLAVGLSIFGGIESTAVQSLLSKCVHGKDYGKIFTIASVTSSVGSLISSAIIQKLYQYTQDTFPGSVYLLVAGVILVTTVMMGVLYVWLIAHERVFGPLGTESEDEAPLGGPDDGLEEEISGANGGVEQRDHQQQ